MLYRLISAVTLAAVATVGTDVKPNGDPDTLVVHEWGTFTSIADQRGEALQWQALQTPGGDDLPCFVERFRRYRGKGFMLGTVRMETPVLYFYAPQPMTVDVSVRFPRGLITEWFPRAEVTPSDPVPDDGLKRTGFTGGATWSGVRVLPQAREDFPVDTQGSHYYLARRTDAAPIEAAGAREKFLFYRGIADVRVAIATVPAPDGGIEVAQRDGGPLGTVILFERRGDRLGFEAQTTAAATTRLPRPALTGSLDRLTAELNQVLVRGGLYAKEAAAMVDTWRDSWFEEGTRVFYVLPRSAVDAMLPLEIRPRPASVERVFVGRMEVITPETKAAVAQALRSRDAAALRKYSRFAAPIVETLLADPDVRLPGLNARSFVYSAIAAPASAPRCR
jgi:hypothetical protein